MAFKDDFEHLKIPLEDIKLATNNFGDKPIGNGGFGKVFKGELPIPEGKITVAFKRLDRRWGQGDTEFWKKIMMLSQYKHENLISLVHFCDEDCERILVYEYASLGSLDSYLGKDSLTWNQLLKICHGAACGLSYLHNPMDHQRVLHRDVKSSNILLDENLSAKISDFGLSKLGPANQQYTYLVSNVVGTPGYCDPVYLETGRLSKESDVYSFGVVLFEVICGRYCCEYYNGKHTKILVPLWKKCYEDDKMDDIVHKNLKEQMDTDSYKTFLNIAYRCLHKDCKERPTMAEIVKELETALDHQEMSQDVNERAKHEERISITNKAATPVSCRSRKELALILSKGILLKGGYRKVSINKNGIYQEMLLLNKSRHGNEINSHSDNFIFSLSSDFELQGRARFLSPHVTYTVNLVYRYWDSYENKRVPLKYKLHTETEYWTSCVAQEMDNGLLSTKLYQFTSSQRKYDFKIDFLAQLRPICDHYHYPDRKPQNSDRHHTRCILHLIGIEFLPVENEIDEKLEEESNVDTQLRRGIFTNYENGQQWLTASKHLKRRHMLPATEILEEGSVWTWSLLRRKSWIWKSLPESRFPLVAEFCEVESFTIACKIHPLLLSRETHYACYLVYKLPEQHSMVSGLVQIDDELIPDYVFDEISGSWENIKDAKEHLVDLLTPTHIPFIGCNADEFSSRTRRVKGHPKLRKDGWMEIQIWDFPYFPPRMTTHMRKMHCRVRTYDRWKTYRSSCTRHRV